VGTNVRRDETYEYITSVWVILFRSMLGTTIFTGKLVERKGKIRQNNAVSLYSCRAINIFTENSVKGEGKIRLLPDTST
jgi:hypothetical protein